MFSSQSWGVLYSLLPGSARQHLGGLRGTHETAVCDLFACLRAPATRRAADSRSAAARTLTPSIARAASRRHPASADSGNSIALHRPARRLCVRSYRTFPRQTLHLAVELRAPA